MRIISYTLDITEHMIPNPTRPDYYWENQYFLDEEKAERKAMERPNKAAAKNTGMLLSILFKLVFGALSWTSGLITAYLILKGFKSFEPIPIWQKVLLIIGTAYVINSILFFLKGIMVALRSSGKKIWLLLWLISCCFVCLPPAIPAYIIVDSYFTSIKGGNFSKAWSVIAGGLIAFIVYFNFGLGTIGTPKLFAWAFKTGIKAI